MKFIDLRFVSMVFLIICISSCKGHKIEIVESPGTIVEDYFKLIINEEFEKAAKMYSNRGHKLTDKEAKKIEDRLSWYANYYEEKGGIKEVFVIAETIIGDHKTAYVKYNLVYHNGEEDDKKQHLEKVDGKWYLIMITK